MKSFAECISLLSSEDQFERERAADALGDIGDPRAFKSLLKALKTAASPEKRWRIWYAIGAIGCAEKIRHLAHLMETPNWTDSPEDRRSIVERSKKPFRRLSTKEKAKINADIAELANADDAARWRAIVRLGRRRGRVVDLLAEATASPNVEMRFGALFALERIGDARSYPVILELTKDPEDHLRWWALHILGEVGGERAIPALIETLLEKEDQPDTWGAADGLVEVGEPAMPALIEAMETASDEKRAIASHALSQIGDERPIPHIAKLLNDRNPSVRMAGIESLEILAEEKSETVRQECIQLIESALADQHEDVRKTAEYSIETLRQTTSS